MAEVKLVVVYPRPLDVSTFDRAYENDHLPKVKTWLAGATRAVVTKIHGTADGSTAPFYRIAEIFFPSMEALQACAATQGAKDAMAHAVSISDGGPPLFMVGDSETISFK